ncbi:MAG TPA: hypothetical protein P5195_08335 [Anaerolineae bacterium]|nr:hypothetical protein [Anaerolineae bacterium]HRU95218.1 hypothetical protein [Anaerolineae bacterium]HXK42545.1 hypothetical protein [Anaerolineae bacterium]
MSRRWQPSHTIALGLGLVVAGAVLPLLMVLGVLKSTFALNFIAYFVSVAGLFLGIIGGATYARRHKD